MTWQALKWSALGGVVAYRGLEVFGGRALGARAASLAVPFSLGRLVRQILCSLAAWWHRLFFEVAWLFCEFLGATYRVGVALAAPLRRWRLRPPVVAAQPSPQLGISKRKR